MRKIALIKAEPAELAETEQEHFHGFYFHLYEEKTDVGKTLFHGFCPDFEISECTSRTPQDHAVIELATKLIETISRHLIALVENGQLDQVYDHVDFNEYGLGFQQTREIEREFSENKRYFEKRIGRVYKPGLASYFLPQARQRGAFGPLQTRTIAS